MQLLCLSLVVMRCQPLRRALAAQADFRVMLAMLAVPVIF
ncbi:hypothetical protein VCHE16_3469 [Vibrio paracholerae HE-16]|nr:hypothetical protein VCHE16_3469 [Vibrio paracholerae HE-16]